MTATFLTERLPARARADVFPLDVVAGVAVGIIVMDTRKDRVPSASLSHLLVPFDY